MKHNHASWNEAGKPEPRPCLPMNLRLQEGHGFSRREFVKRAAMTIGAAACGNTIGFPAEASGQDRAKTSAAIIGHTGKGDYGHGLDQIFNNRENIEVVGVADPVPSGRVAVAAKSK